MTFDEWIALIRDVAHTGDEAATWRLVRRLGCGWTYPADRWHEVCAYAEVLDFERIAGVVAPLCLLDGRRLHIPASNHYPWHIPQDRYEGIWWPPHLFGVSEMSTPDVATQLAVVQFLRARFWKGVK